MPKVLLLETDKLLARNVAKTLEARGFEVNWQVDPQEAILAIDAQPVDLVVMDLVLANHSGVEFLYEFRSYQDWQTMPVVVYSSLPMSELDYCDESLRQLSISAYHHKPDTLLAQLADSVEGCLQLSPA